jgi:DNA anti-recombination protein RmuC
MDEETKARFDDVSAALGTINTVLAGIIEGMATKKELDARFDAIKKELDARFDAIMARMNEGFERVLEKQHTLQVADDTLSQRVTRLEQDMRQLRGGI